MVSHKEIIQSEFFCNGKKILSMNFLMIMNIRNKLNMYGLSSIANVLKIYDYLIMKGTIVHFLVHQFIFNHFFVALFICNNLPKTYNIVLEDV